MKSLPIVTLIFLFAASTSLFGQETMPLYEGEIPNSRPSAIEEVSEDKEGMVRVSKITKPTLTIFLPSPETANGTAVLICPGGGYWINAINHEGMDVARKLIEKGIAAFVLKYRIPNVESMINKEVGPLQDVQQALTIIRKNASKWKINSGRIGVMGFSAGGHLASTAGTHFKNPVIETTEKVRPDFMILIYPVITFLDSITHMGSRKQLIGENPTVEKIRLFSNELQVTRDTPPTFLVHASDDGAVKSENSILFYRALLKNNIKAELHIYQRGGHGFGLNNKTTSDQWFERCINWMDSNGWMKK